MKKTNSLFIIIIIVLTCFLSSWKVEATNHLRKDSVSNNDSINIKEDFIYWISHMDDSATIENGIAEFNSFLSEYTKKNKIDITGWVDKYAETRDMLYKGEYLGRYLSYRLIVLYHLDFIKIEDNWENRLNFFLVCVKHNDYEVLDLLDFRDSALEGDSCYGETVLTVAVRGNNIKMVKYLLKRGVDINKRELPACYDDAVEEKNAYEIALDLGYKDIADLLKKYHFNYESFKSYFNRDTAMLIPENIYTKEILYKNFESRSYSKQIYALQSILGYKGMDLFVCNEVVTYIEDSTYEDDNTDCDFLIAFKDGKPLCSGNDDFSGLLRFSGGDIAYTDQSYRFDKDTTILIETDYSERITDNSDYNIKTHSVVRYEIDSMGVMIPTEILSVTFSSMLLDSDTLLLDNNAPPYRLFPIADADDFPLKLFIDYKKETNGYYRPVLESFLDNEKVDKYYVGMKPEKIRCYNKNYLKNGAIKISCPIIIKTLDGDIELMPDGYFRKFSVVIK